MPRKVLLIMTDDQPYHTLSAMPNVLSRIVAKGVKFNNAYVASPVCGPARAATLTGKHSHTSGVTETNDAWRELKNSGQLARAIPKRLRDKGFRTFHTGKFTNDISDPKDIPTGFTDWYTQLEDLNKDDYTRWSQNGKERTFKRGDGMGNESIIAANYCVDFIERMRGGKWYAQLWLHSPHGPYHALGNHSKLYRGEEPPTNVGEADVSDKSPEARKDMDRQSVPASKEEYREKLREVRDCDVAVGKVLDALKQTNQLDDTLIIFMTDNGYQHNEHNLDKKNLPYEESMRMPFVIAGPGIPNGVSEQNLVSQVDVLETIMDYTSGNDGGTDGRSLKPLIENNSVNWRENLLIEKAGESASDWDAVRSRYRKDNGQIQNLLYIKWKSGWEEIYDYDEDPHLLNGNVSSPDEDAHRTRLRQTMNTMLTASGDAMRTAEQR